MSEYKHIEQTIIASMLTPDDNHKEILPQLSEQIFTDELCKKLYTSIKAIADSGLTPNIVTLFAYLKKEKSEHVAAISQITQWIAALSFNVLVSEYVAMLKDAHIDRQVDSIVVIESMNSTEHKTGAERAYALIQKLTSLIDTGAPTDNIVTTPDLASDEREAYYRRAALAASGETVGLNTGLKALNRFTGGLQPEFIILAGRPSMGKTAFALFLACQFKKHGVYFNLEMNNSQLCQRLILQNSNDAITASRLRDGTLTQPELHAFEQGIAEVEKLPLTIYDKARCGVHEACRVIKRLHRQGKCQWAIIDYLQLMTLEGFKGSRELEVAEISRTLKATQKELSIPIIALAQLSRNVEQRADKKPILSDLRESGSLEQDADTVLFIWRPEYYGLADDSGMPYSNEVFLLAEKHRQGATGEVMFRSNKTITRFFDAEMDNGSSFLPQPFKHQSSEFDNEPF